jgi:hypothetical protein
MNVIISQQVAKNERSSRLSGIQRLLLYHKNINMKNGGLQLNQMPGGGILSRGRKSYV